MVSFILPPFHRGGKIPHPFDRRLDGLRPSGMNVVVKIFFPSTPGIEHFLPLKFHFSNLTINIACMWPANMITVQRYTGQRKLCVKLRLCETSAGRWYAEALSAWSVNVCRG
jgi:hypothetical protein